MSQRYSGGIITANPTAPTTTSASGVWTLEQQFQNSANWPLSPTQISRSVRLRNSATGYFTRVAGTPTSQNVWTVSMWVKLGNLMASSGAPNGCFFGANQAGNPNESIKWNGPAEGGSAQIYYQSSTAGGTNNLTRFIVNNLRDPGAWYHLVFQKNASAASGTGCFLAWINGVAVTFTGGYTGTQASVPNYINVAGSTFNIGAIGSANSLDAYLAEVNFVDGQALTPSSFGFTDGNGLWQPTGYAGTYGNNGFYCNFSDNSSNTAATIGKDYSGNGNNLTPNNISVTAGTTYDSMLDVPTNYADGGNGRGNYPVWNVLKKYAANMTFTNGNLTVTDTSASGTSASATMRTPTSGKWYWEVTATTISSTLGFVMATTEANADAASMSGANGFYRSNGTIGNLAGTAQTSGATYASGDVIGIAVDVDNGTVQFYKNGTAQGATPSFTFTAGTIIVPAVVTDNVAGTKVFAGNFGQQPFAYTPPTGFVALNTQNLPAPTISNGASYMAATTYTGTGSALTIANTVGSASFQPDFVWIKSRSNALSHKLVNSVVGIQLALSSDSTAAESSDTGGVTAFNSNGFTIGTTLAYNTSAATFVAWQWNAGGSTVTNTSGTISAQVRANPTAGFSVVGYTGTGANATVGHGLGVAPSIIITKVRSTTGADWNVYHASIGNTKSLFLNTTAAPSTSVNFWNNTSPTSTVFSVGISGGTNNSGNTMIAYCFAAVAGYSAFGSYTGNGSADGPFVYLGFRPKYVLWKSAGEVSYWNAVDTTRTPANVVGEYLSPNVSSAEATTALIDILSNGFKLRVASAGNNTNATTYIYMAFAENPFKNSRAR